MTAPLPPGPELDKATALAMGLTIRHEGAALLVQLTKGGFWHVWRPSQSRQQACTVVLDWLMRRDLPLSLHFHADGGAQVCGLNIRGCTALTLEHALCLAVLALSEAA